MVEKKSAGGNGLAGPGAVKDRKPQILKVKAGQKYRGAREAWYERLMAYNDKPLDAFLESVKEKSPSLTKAGAAEPPMGWVRWFERSGVLKVVVEK